MDEHDTVYYKEKLGSWPSRGGGGGTLWGPTHVHDVPRGAIIFLKATDNSEFMGAIVGCVACFSCMIFALRKTTERKRVGFWRETICPFLTAAAMTGMGAAIAALAVPGIVETDEELAGAVVGLVFGSLLFLVLLFVGGRGGRRSRLVAGQVPTVLPNVADPLASAPGIPDAANVGDGAPVEDPHRDEPGAG